METFNTTREWQIDKAHSSIEFSVRHMMISNVKGSFGEFDAKANLQIEDLSNSKVHFEIRTASVNTNERDRDNHLRSPDFFHSDKYPTIRFESKNISKDGENVKITGLLTIKEVTRDVLVVGELQGPIKDPYGFLRMGFDGELNINRKDYGLNWNMALEAGGILVGENVKSLIHLELISK
jgi:polyisoprenoid-binding protein YceI